MKETISEFRMILMNRKISSYQEGYKHGYEQGKRDAQRGKDIQYNLPIWADILLWGVLALAYIVLVLVYTS